MKISAKNKEILQMVNPFGEADVNGKPVAYQNPRDAYLAVLNKMLVLFPQGYVDVPLLFCKLTGNPLVVMPNIGKRDMVNFDWEDRAHRDECLIKVMLILLRYTRCTFSDNAFRAALYEFDRDLTPRLEKLNETLIQNKKNITIT